ncbi:MAG: tetratricopeptide repeat protein [Magnetococcales bacterium]|nr:tetratricopeptide repeat protein [Magnetococcales bacterium]
MTTVEEAYKAAIDHFNSGGFGEAEQLCQAIVKDSPHYIDAINLLGVIAQKSNRHAVAVDHFNRAIDIHNGSEFLFYNLATSLFPLGYTHKAVVALEKAVDINPKFYHGWCRLGFGQRELGEFDKAAFSYQQAILINPDNSEPYFFLANSQKQQGDLAGAIANYRKATALAPDHADAHHNLGIALQLNNELDKAFESYQKTIAIRPDYVEAISNLGYGLQMAGRLAEAVAILQKAIAVGPGYGLAYYNLGVTLHELNRIDEAIRCYEKAIELNPQDAKGHFNLANCLKEQGRGDEAILGYEKAVGIDPGFYTAFNNLGVVLQEMGEFAKADINYKKAIAIKPDYADAHHNLALDELVAGDFAKGWRSYNWRWQTEHHDSERFNRYRDRMWSGQKVAGKRFLLWAEQGIGESILFSGMFAELIERGAKVVIECDRRLIPLFGRSFPGAVCVEKGDVLTLEGGDNGFDFIMPFGNLSPLLRGGLDSFPGRSAYLIADETKRRAIRERYLKKNGDGVLVGITWRSTSPKYRGKSVNLVDLKGLLGLPNAIFVDLQYGDTVDERKRLRAESGVEVIHDDLIDQGDDLDGFAAQVAAMDFVVTISSTTAHMAGALGVPTLLMLAKFSLWFWMMDRDDSPWYSCINVFRQQKRDEWGDVIRHVTDRLREQIEKKHRSNMSS